MIRLVQTCYACPEQYDAFDGEKPVGYLRLRHGFFRVDCPEYGGQEVYSSSAMRSDGRFEDDERDYFLKFAVDAIQKWRRGEVRGLPPAPEVEYLIE